MYVDIVSFIHKTMHICLLGQRVKTVKTVHCVHIYIMYLLYCLRKLYFTDLALGPIGTQL